MVKVIGVNAFFKAFLKEEAIHVNNCFVSKQRGSFFLHSKETFHPIRASVVKTFSSTYA